MHRKSKLNGEKLLSTGCSEDSRRNEHSRKGEANFDHINEHEESVSK
jgi:hypothetical protein